VLVVVGLRYMSVLRFVCLCVIVKSGTFILLACYCQIKDVHTHVVFICGIELYVIYLIFVCIDGMWVSSFCIIYD
jgi:hypothetical protein